MPVPSSGTGRPFVVHFANPRKATPGLPADPGLAPRKLFIGQVTPRHFNSHTSLLHSCGSFVSRRNVDRVLLACTRPSRTAHPGTIERKVFIRTFLACTRMKPPFALVGRSPGM